MVGFSFASTHPTLAFKLFILRKQFLDATFVKIYLECHNKGLSDEIEKTIIMSNCPSFSDQSLFHDVVISISSIHIDSFY